MRTREEINMIENRLRNVFNKDRITKIEVNECNGLLERWKELTDYVPKKEPVLYSIIDNEPNWQNKNNE